MKRTRSVGEALVGLLEDHGVRTVFGIPGVHTLELYRSLPESGITHIAPRHEQGAGFMADGWARVNGNGPGVCFVITGPGVTNIATPLAQAYHDSQPLLVISADTARQGRGHGSLHELPDQSAVTRPLCGSSVTVTDPEQLPQALFDAYRLFSGGRPRPAHISIPLDVLSAPAPQLEAIPVEQVAIEPRPDEIRVASDALIAARRPMIILGGGAADAGAEAGTLAELLGAPIVTTVNAKDCLPESHPFSLGCALPTEAVLGELDGADVVLAVGTELSTVEVLALDRAIELSGTVIRIDVDPVQLRDPRFDTIGVLADARLAVRALGQELQRRGLTPRVADRVESLRADMRWWPEAESVRPWLDALSRSIGSEPVVALDSTQLAYSGVSCISRSGGRPRSWLVPNGLGTLGPALPMAIGAQVAQPERPALAVAGDGGVLFTISELATAVQENLTVVLLVWDNQVYQEIADSMDRAAMPHTATNLTPIDFVGLGRAFGSRAERVTTPDALEDAVVTALAADGPTVLHVLDPA
jgi:thiamine pyrophosphate-dependent acetolactate synthase large subunit-like protein